MLELNQALATTLFYPNGGEVIQTGQQVNIQWQSSGAVSHVVKLSTDGGVSYSDISPQLSGGTSIFSWSVPNMPTGQARIRIASRNEAGERVTDDSNGNFSIVAAAAPIVFFVNPGSGPLTGGTSVTIDGANFANGCRARFGGVDSAQVTFISPTRIVALSPAQATTGPANIRVVNPDGQAGVLTNGFTYTQAISVPEIFSLNPTSGPLSGGTPVTIDGRNFAPGCIVRFGGVDAVTTFISSTRLSVITPAQNTAGFVNIRVVNPDTGFFVFQSGYQYVQAPAPAIFSLSQSSGPLTGGNTISIFGANFQNGARARFGTIDAATTFINSGQLTATVPAGAALGFVNLRVTNPDGQFIVQQNGYQYLSTAPQIFGVAPGNGPTTGGTGVVITGQNFQPGVKVRFGGVDATTVGLINPNQLTATTPPQIVSGPVNVRIINPNGEFAVLENGFTYTAAPAPTITSIAPGSGPLGGGNSVTVFGANFQNGARVRFGGVDAITTFINSGQLNAVVPAGGATGFVNVRVANPDGQFFVLANGYQYVATGVQIFTVAPGSGPLAGGTTVVITGQNFQPGVKVRFGGVDAASVGLINQNQLTATTPPQGVAGPVNVRVINPDGSVAVLENGFSYIDPVMLPPDIISISPNSGSIAGGTAVTIDGANFRSGAQVRFGGVDSPQVTFISNTRLIATTPAAAAGTVNVRVINPDGQADALENAFQYRVITLQVFSVGPNQGPVSGGTNVVITGENFQPGVTIRFGGTDATNVNLINPNQLTATTPPQALAGVVNVRAVNPDGGFDVLENGFTYVAPGVPEIDSVSPASGPMTGGTTVTINGRNFQPGIKVRFGGTDAPVVSFIGGTVITATTPASLIAGAVNVRVVNPDGQADVLENGFQYLASSALQVIPASGPVTGKTLVTIRGTGFMAGARVRFGGLDATNVVFVSTTEVRAITPSQAAPGPVTVRVINPNGTVIIGQNAFTYTAIGTPMVRVTAPNGGELLSAGATTTIRWSSSGASSHRVQYSIDNGATYVPIITGLPGSAQSYDWVIPETIVPAVQQSIRTLVRVIARNDSGLEAFDVSDAPFTIGLGSAIQPAITGLTPLVGTVGTAVEIAGSNFTDVMEVLFGGVRAAFRVLSADTISATVPLGAVTGPVVVRTSEGMAQSPVNFTVSRIIRQLGGDLFGTGLQGSDSFGLEGLDDPADRSGFPTIE